MRMGGGGDHCAPSISAFILLERPWRVKEIMEAAGDKTQYPTKELTAVPIYSIMGKIGVGKTTLLKEAKAMYRCPVFVELVNGSQLDDYIHGRISAAAFQMAMMHGACTRTLNALEMAEDCNLRAIFLERPAQENVIFARANWLHGNMTRFEWDAFKRAMAD